jgi:MFS family permease
MGMQRNSIWTKKFVAALASIAACDVAFGLTFQLQPLILEARHTPAWLIGTLVAMGPLGLLLAGPLLPKIISVYGLRLTAIVATIMIAVLLFLFAMLDPFWSWFPLRFVLGIATGALFTTSETWMLTAADDTNRGSLMGLYTSVLAVTFGIGPTIIPFTGIDGWAPWLICMGFVCAGLIPLFMVPFDTAALHSGSGSILSVVRRQPIIFVCAVAATLFDAILISFFTIYAVRVGIPLEKASTMLGVSIIGGVVLYYPMGILADRWSRDAVVAWCTLLTIAAGLLIPYVIDTIFIWPLMLIFVATGFGTYVVALAAIGTAFEGKDVIAASAAIAGTWGIGGIAGPPVVGRLIDVFGIAILPHVLTCIYVVLMVLLIFNGMRVLKPKSVQA